MTEAKALASDSVPSIFSLINLLQDSGEVQSVINGPEVSYSFAPDLVPDHIKALESGDPTDALFAGLNIRDDSGKKGNKKTNQDFAR